MFLTRTLIPLRMCHPDNGYKMLFYDIPAKQCYHARVAARLFFRFLREKHNYYHRKRYCSYQKQKI